MLYLRVGLSFIILFILVYVWNLWAKRSTNNRRLPFPPGPRPLPIIGNLRDLPSEESQVATYFRWRKQYGTVPISQSLLQFSKNIGDLVHVEVLGRHILFLNSYRVVNDLFEKRSANYSDRNELPMINDLSDSWPSCLSHHANFGILQDGLGLELWSYALRCAQGSPSA